MTPREQLAKTLFDGHASLVMSMPSFAPERWDELPHERQRVWLELAATAERTIAGRESVRYTDDDDDLPTVDEALRLGWTV